MVRSRSALFGALVALAASSAVAQNDPPVPAWRGAGEHCAFGLHIVVPQGYEVRFPPGGVDLRIAGVEDDAYWPGGYEIRALSTGGPYNPEPPLLREYAECADGAPAEILRESRDSPNVAPLGLVTQRCGGPGGAYGVVMSNGKIALEAGEFEALGLFHFGDDPTPGLVSLSEAGRLTEEEAWALFEATTASMRACPSDGE